MVDYAGSCLICTKFVSWVLRSLTCWRVVSFASLADSYDSAVQPVVQNLGYTKAGKHQGAAESVTITEQHVLRHLWSWKNRMPRYTYLTSKPYAWRSLFSECIHQLKLESWGFRPYSLRRGGAIHLFVKCGSLG